MLPQSPQFAVLFRRLVSQPSEAVSLQLPQLLGLVQDATEHAPLEQLAVAFFREHLTHALPPVPQALAVGVWHLFSESQQPLGHEVESHTHSPSELHLCLASHCTHSPPATPHVAFDEATHLPFEQQPLQLVPPQLQTPFSHDSPVPQPAQAFPFLPHELLDWTVL
jgi:hypothetical protein